MIEGSVESQCLYWTNKITKEEPFMAEDLLNLLFYIYLVHEKPLNDDDPRLDLETPNPEFFYRLSYYPGDPEDSYDPDEEFQIYFMKHRTEEDIRKSLEDNSRPPVRGCVIPTEDQIELNLIKRSPKEISMWRHVDEGRMYSPMAGIDLINESGEIRIYDTRQNAQRFGRNLAKNLWDASTFTLKQRNAYNFEN